MSGYSDVIGEAIQRDDLPTLELVESFIRVERPTLDALTKQQLVRLAKRAYAQVQYDPDFSRQWCELMHIEVPDWLGGTK